MIKKEDAMIAIANGIVAICAWCEHWHEAKHSGCAMPCGGPSAMMGFPLYRGPYQNYTDKICYICGDDADCRVEIGGNRIGLCDKNKKNKKSCIDIFKDVISRSNVEIVEK